MAEQKTLARKPVPVDWSIYAALVALEGIGEMLNPETGFEQIAGALDAKAVERILYAVAPLAQFARERIEKLYNDCDGMMLIADDSDSTEEAPQ